MSRAKALAFIRARSRRINIESNKVQDEANRLARDVKIAIKRARSSSWTEKEHKRALSEVRKAAGVFARRVREISTEAGIQEWDHSAHHYVESLGEITIDDVLEYKAKSEIVIQDSLKVVTKEVTQYVVLTFSAMSLDALAGRKISSAVRMPVSRVAKVISSAIKKKASHKGSTYTVTIMTDASTIAGDDAVKAAIKKSKKKTKSKKKKKRLRLTKEWVTDAASNVCEDCDELDGETVLHSEDFSDGSEGPPLHPRCQCLLFLART